jgi:hypothetical protein
LFMVVQADGSYVAKLGSSGQKFERTRERSKPLARALASVVTASVMTVGVARADAPPVNGDPVLSGALPRLWTMTPPLGNAANDGRLVQAAKIDGFYLLPGSRGGASAGELLGRELEAVFRQAGDMKARGKAAVFFFSFAKGNLRYGEPNPPPGDPMRMPALYAHEADAISYIGTRVDGSVGPVTKRTLWMSNGLAETRAWTADFLNAYRAYRWPVADGRVPPLQRVIFDQEVFDTEWNFPPIFANGTQDVEQVNDRRYIFSIERGRQREAIDWWNAVKADPRFFTEPLVGMGEVTLNGTRVPATWGNLWLAAGSPDLSMPAAPNWRFVLESQENERWFRWYFQLARVAQNIALHKGFGEQYVAAFPTGKYSDYDMSIQTDAQFPWVDGRYFTTAGVHPVIDAGFGGATLQGIQLYPFTSIWHTAGGLAPQNFTQDIYVRSFTDFPYSWAEDMEPQAETVRRIHKSKIDHLIYAEGGQNRWTITPWIALPHQIFAVRGKRLLDPARPYDFTTGWGFGYRTSPSDLRRILGMTKSRGVRELMVWHDLTSYEPFDCDDNGGPPCISLFPSHAANWNTLSRLLDQTYGTKLVGVSFTNGLRQDINPNSTTALCEYLGGPPSQAVITSTSPWPTWTETTAFAEFTVSAAALAVPTSGARIDAAMEVLSVGTPITVSVDIYNWTTGLYVPVDLDPSTSQMTRVITAPGTLHLDGQVDNPQVVASLTQTGQPFGRIRVRVRTLSQGLVPHTMGYDMINAYPVDDLERCAPPQLDFNCDGMVNKKDIDEYHRLADYVWKTFPSPYSAKIGQRDLRLFLDWNYDGVIESFPASARDAMEMERDINAFMLANPNCPR